MRIAVLQFSIDPGWQEGDEDPPKNSFKLYISLSKQRFPIKIKINPSKLRPCPKTQPRAAIPPSPLNYSSSENFCHFIRRFHQDCHGAISNIVVSGYNIRAFSSYILHNNIH